MVATAAYSFLESGSALCVRWAGQGEALLPRALASGGDSPGGWFPAAVFPFKVCAPPALAEARHTCVPRRPVHTMACWPPALLASLDFSPFPNWCGKSPKQKKDVLLNPAWACS